MPAEAIGLRPKQMLRAVTQLGLGAQQREGSNSEAQVPPFKQQGDALEKGKRARNPAR